ncbi:hypothetical protein D9M69_627900 [compost metagenome]
MYAHDISGIAANAVTVYLIVGCTGVSNHNSRRAVISIKAIALYPVTRAVIEKEVDIGILCKVWWRKDTVHNPGHEATTHVYTIRRIEVCSID